MNDGQSSRSISSLWRHLKRALISAPDIQNGSPVCLECGMRVTNSSNVSNNVNNESVLISERPMSENPEIAIKRQRLNIVADKIGPSEENSFMEIMKNLLSCSICLEVSSYSNQCPNGHLICITCSGRLQQTPGDLNCPVCRISLKQGLHRSLLAEQLTSELPAECKFCDTVMAVKYIKKHETDECNKRMVPCKYKMFGCDWIGIKEVSEDHEDVCSISNKTVGMLREIVNENIARDLQSLQSPLQLWKAIISKLRVQAVGSRMLIRQTTLNKSNSDDVNQTVFKSPMIRIPFTCCSLHGFYLDMYVTKINETESEKVHYVFRSENRTKINLMFYLLSIKINETINLDVQDSLHSHQFESSHKDSSLHEFKIISLDSQKDVPKLSELDTIFAEICILSERERSEKSHGILNSTDEDETNPFLSNGSDSNVVFTLFSPTTSASRSINTSNTMISANDDVNAVNEVEPSHEEDIVITVTDNVDSGDDISNDNRDNITMRNNHGFVAVPSVFINPATSVFTYSPFSIDNSFVPNTFIQQSRLSRDSLNYEQLVQQLPQENQQTIASDQDLIRFQTISGNRNGNSIINESISALDSNRAIREPIQMSFFYPPQTIVSPYITNAVPQIPVRSSISPRNSGVRQRLNTYQISSRQSNIPSNSDDSGLNSFENTATDSSITDISFHGNSAQEINGTRYEIPNNNESLSSSFLPNQAGTLLDLTMQEEIEN